MDVAQYLVDNDYSLNPDEVCPPAPNVTLEQNVITDAELGYQVTNGVKILWDTTSASHENFKEYKVSKGQKNTTGSIDWSIMANYTDTVGSTSWPPPKSEDGTHYQLVDTDVIKGLVYYYSVQAFTNNITEPIPFGVLHTNIIDAKSCKLIAPANPVALTTLKNVKVVPNPYIGSARWNNHTQRRQSVATSRAVYQSAV
jgi:hypothetical protein